MNYKKLIILLFIISFSKLFCQNDINVGIQEKFDKAVRFYEKNKLDSSLFYFKKIEKNNLPELKGETYYYLGHIYKNKQDFESSLNYFKTAEKEFTKANDENAIAKNYISISEFYRAKYDFDLAEEYLNKAEVLLENTTITNHVKAYYWNRKAAIYTEKYHDAKNSIKCSEKVIALAKEINDSSLMASSYNEIAFIYENLDDKRAESYYKKSIEISDKLGDDLTQCHVLLNLVRYYYRNKKISSAKNLIDKADELVKKNDFIKKKKEVCDKYYLYYADAGDYKTALEYHEELLELEKEDLINKWNEELVETERKYELDSANESLKLQELSIEKKNAEILSSKRRLFYAISFLIALIALAFVIIFFYSQVKYKNKKLKKLSEENTFLVSETNHRVNNNLQLIAYLISDIIRKKKNENEKIEFVKLLSKVEAIATIHRHLYVNKESQEINISHYLADLKLNFDNIGIEKNINIQFQIDEITTNSNTATYLGLLLTELFINSVKHAFTESQEKKIDFSLTNEKNNISFSYKDNGENSKNKEIKPKLVAQLCQQLDLAYTINTKNGFHFYFVKNLAQKS